MFLDGSPCNPELSLQEATTRTTMKMRKNKKVMVRQNKSRDLAVIVGILKRISKNIVSLKDKEAGAEDSEVKEEGMVHAVTIIQLRAHTEELNSLLEVEVVGEVLIICIKLVIAISTRKEWAMGSLLSKRRPSPTPKAVVRVSSLGSMTTNGYKRNSIKNLQKMCQMVNLRKITKIIDSKD